MVLSQHRFSFRQVYLENKEAEYMIDQHLENICDEGSVSSGSDDKSSSDLYLKRINEAHQRVKFYDNRKMAGARKEEELDFFQQQEQLKKNCLFLEEPEIKLDHELANRSAQVTLHKNVD